MSFQSEVNATKSLKVNLVIKIKAPAPVGDVYFSKYQVQSGLVVPAANVGMVESFSVPGSQIDLLTAKSDVGSATVEILDKDNTFSTFLGQPLSALIGLSIDLYVGLITDSGMAFADYIFEKQNYIIKSVTWRSGKFSLSCKSPADRMQTPIFNFRGNLNTLISDVATSCVINTGTDTFKAATGLNPQRAKIGNEFVQYTGKTFSSPNTTLTGLTRGDESSTAAIWKSGTECFFVQRSIANPIDMILQLLTSTGAGTNGAYDVLHDGVKIPLAQIDTAKFASVKATFFPSDTFTLFYYDIENAMKYMEVELLQANNLRLTELNGKISIAVLDQSVPGDTLPIVDADVILARPAASWQISENRLFNQFTMEFFYVEGTQSYAKTLQFNDLNSQSIHGIRKGATLSFKGITTEAIASERGNRLMDRFSSPQSEIGVTQFLKTYNTPPGDKVTFIHPDLPTPGGGVGINHELELLKRAINYATGLVQATYVFTSYANLRRGLIAPNDAVVSIIAANKITVGVGRGILWKVGYVVNLFSNVTHLVVDGGNNVITDVTGDTITFQNNFTGLVVSTTFLRFADYDFASDLQRAKYMFIVGGSGLFADGTGGYKIY